MSKPIHVQIIQAARALVADENNWCCHQMAFDAYGVPVCATDGQASKLCAYGALIAAAHKMTGDGSRAQYLTRLAARHFGRSDALIRVNDTQGHAAVLALFDEAISNSRRRNEPAVDQ